MYFLDQTGNPMERCVDQDTGKVNFKPIQGGNTITYKYKNDGSVES